MRFIIKFRMRYSIVNFVDDNTAEVVPTSWIKDDVCLWPPYRGEKLKSLVKQCSTAESSWSS